MKKISLGLGLATVLLALSGCGGSSGNATMNPTPDAFLVQVRNVVASSSDSSEPVSLDAIVATAPEDTEPVSVN